MNASAAAKQMIEDIEGEALVNNWPVYREVHRLVEAGLIEPVPETWPIRYRLSSAGRRSLAYEKGRALRTYRQLQERL
jgi:hypothetical protein